MESQFCFVFFVQLPPYSQQQNSIYPFFSLVAEENDIGICGRYGNFPGEWSIFKIQSFSFTFHLFTFRVSQPSTRTASFALLPRL